jgi:predicted aconitase
MDAYVAMGCTATWTCAPYQLASRPSFGSQIAWGESNAIVFANSVLGARTNRYGDFTDICCALTGRAPFSGLHTDTGRLATLLIEVRVPDRLLDMDLTYPLIGHVLGQRAGSRVAVLTGLDDRAGEDRLKAVGAAAASSGAVGMFHLLGVTPEAGDMSAAAGDNQLESTVIDLEALSSAHSELGADGGAVGAVSVGTPHMSLSELTKLAELVVGRSSQVPFYVNTARDTLAIADEAGLLEPIETFGATLVTDTCTYVTAIIGKVEGRLMTDSGKLAFYAPANLGLDVTIASLNDCVDSAVAGMVQTLSLIHI